MNWGAVLWWPHWPVSVWHAALEWPTLGALYLWVALSAAAFILGQRPREAIALLTGWLVVMATLLSRFLSWVSRHPAGHLHTFLDVNGFCVLWLLLPILAVMCVALLALRMLDGFDVPRSLGGVLIQPLSLLAVPLLGVGYVLHLPALLQGGMALIGIRVGLALWQGSASGSASWVPAVLPAQVRRLWHMPMQLTLAGIALLLADSYFWR